MSDYKLYKLISGEEIIGKVEKEDDSNVVLSTVRLMTVQQHENGNPFVAMIPWMIGAPTSSIELSKSSIIGNLSGDVSSELEKGYIQQTTGIQMATTKDVPQDAILTE